YLDADPRYSDRGTCSRSCAGWPHDLEPADITTKTRRHEENTPLDFLLPPFVPSWLLGISTRTRVTATAGHAGGPALAGRTTLNPSISPRRLEDMKKHTFRFSSSCLRAFVPSWLLGISTRTRVTA